MCQLNSGVFLLFYYLHHPGFKCVLFFQSAYVIVVSAIGLTFDKPVSIYISSMDMAIPTYTGA